MIAIGIAIPLSELQAGGALVPSNALLAEDGTPLKAEDGSYLLAE